MKEIIEEAINQSKMMYEAQKEEIFNNTLKENKKLKQEIERLNNIINEINNAFEDNNIHNNMELVRKIKNILKGVDKE